MTTNELRATYEAASRRVQEAAAAIQAAGPRDDLETLERELDEAVAEGERCRGNLEIQERADAARAAFRSDDRGDTVPVGDGGAGVSRLAQWFGGQLRALGVGSGSGSYLVPPMYLLDYFDRLRARSVGLASGFTVIPIDRDELHVPRLTASMTAAWTAEGGTISTSDPTVDEVVATPRKLAALATISNELRRDAPVELLQMIFDDLASGLALKLDLGFFEGSGTPPEIDGLKNVSGIQEVSMGTNGAALTNLDPFADAISLLETENAQATAVVMHPRSWQALLKLKEQTTGNNKPLLQESAGAGTAGVQRAIYGVQVFLSSQLSITETQGSASNASSAYVYEAARIVAVRREELLIEVDGSRLFNSDQSEIRAISRWDVAVPNVKAVCRVKGIIP